MDCWSVRQQWTQWGQTASYPMLMGCWGAWCPHPQCWFTILFFLLLFGLFAWEGLEDCGGWVGGLMSSHAAAALASAPVSEEGCEISLPMSPEFMGESACSHVYEHAGEPVGCHFSGATHPVF